MTTTPQSRTFLAYVRQGLAAQITQPASVTATLPARGDLPVGIQVNSRTPVTLDLQTYGPGDVIGFDAGQVARTEPMPNTASFEADLLAAVEFARPDLPWLLTPAAPDPANGRILPWLCLVVVTADASSVTTTPGAPLPVLTCPLAELPDLTESWAWAHAQVTGPPAASVDSLLTTAGAALSRLICPRRLAPGTAYNACVVPAFIAGVLAGLGQPVPAGNLAPAWAAGSPATVALPVYYHWSFATGASGDFATLASRLRPMAIQAEFGLRGIDISAADPEIPAPDSADAVLGMSGAAGAASGTVTVPAAFAAALETVIAGGVTGVGPPVYGGKQAGTGTSLPPAGTRPQWLRDLNLNPLRRAAAGLGTQVVQSLQEQLMASAWAQAADLAPANRLLSRGRLARAVSSALHRKHLPAGPATATGPQQDRLVQLTGPAHARIRPATAQQTVAGQVSASAPVAATVSIPYRRAARPLGPLARKLGAVPAAPLPPPLAPITSGSLVVTPPTAAPAGLVSLDSVSGGTVTFRGITPQLINGVPQWWLGVSGGFLAPADGFWSDLIAFRATGNGVAWRVGQHLDFDARPLSGWQAEQQLATSASHQPQAVAGTVFHQQPGQQSIMAVLSIDPPPNTRTFELYVGTGVGPTGAVSSWAAPVPIGTATAVTVTGADLLVTSGIVGTASNLIVMWVEQASSGVQTAKYRMLQNVIWQLPVRDNGATVTLPFTPAGDFGMTGGRIGPAGQGGGGSPDVLVWWITGPPGARTGQYVIGWQFGSSGPASWSAPITIPAALPDNTVALGAALADIDLTGQPDLVLYYVEQLPATPAGGPQFQGCYLVGWDLSPSGVPAAGWTSVRDISGSWASTGAGGSLGLASLDPVRLQDILSTGQNFGQQSARLQQALLAPVTLPAPPPAPPPFTSGQLAATAGGALDPAATLPARLLPQVQLGGTPVAPPASADPLAPLVVTPTFPQPMYQPLRELAANILLPSAEAIPPDTVTLLQADPAFIESYLVGLNHEMSRLLAWRGYPADGTGTYFQYFWDRPAGSTAGPDIPPISSWNPAAPLGGHATSVGSAGMLLLVVRGTLPARWPGLLVRASQAAFSSGPGGQVKNPTDVWLDPVFSGRVEPDLSFYGFQLTAAQARSNTSSATGGWAGWFFVFAERPFECRFGLEPMPQPPAYGGQPTAWASLTWGQLAADATSYGALRQISAAHPPAALSNLTIGGVTFGHNAAHMAAITLRLPFQVAIHADELLAGL